jgi:hypothetical protein
VLAVQTEVIVEGKVAAVSPVETLLGWEYVEVNLAGVTEVWSPGPPPPPEEGVVPPLPSELSFILPADGGDLPDVGETVRVMLRSVVLPDPAGSAWLAVNGHAGLLDTGVPAEALASEMDESRAKRDEFILDARARALEILRPIAAEVGRIPLVTDDPPESAPVDYEELYRSPLVIEKEGIRVVFDRWFFTLLDGMARVTITSSDGEMMAEGPVEGPDAIMRELPDHSFEFVDGQGRVVAVVTQAELSNAATLADEEFMGQSGP